MNKMMKKKKKMRPLIVSRLVKRMKIEIDPIKKMIKHLRLSSRKIIKRSLNKSSKKNLKKSKKTPKKISRRSPNRNSKRIIKTRKKSSKERLLKTEKIILTISLKTSQFSREGQN